ncbi:MAG: PDZ domain-containing protein [Planctomycetes bacterium]|nr:PDZ domain-containing protein [Planctomycetota bacterium]
MPFAVVLGVLATPLIVVGQADEDGIADEAAPVTDDEFRVPLDEATAREIDALIPLLGVPLYAERERATERLKELGIKTFARLREAHRVADDPEVQWRIEQIVEDAYFEEYVFGRNGFLGITQNARLFPSHEEDPRIREGHVGIMVESVHQNTAAARGGLRQGDVIIAFDGEPLKASPRPTEEFGNRIRSRAPGTRVVLTVLRDTFTRELEVTLGRCPPEMVKSGNIQAVAQRYWAVRDRFVVWWTRYFRGVGTENAGEPPR